MFAFFKRIVFMTTPLRSRLQAALLAGKDLSEELKLDSSRPLKLAEAVEICEFLSAQKDIRPLIAFERSEFHTPLNPLVMVFQSEAEEGVSEHLREHGLPELHRLCELALAEPDAPANPLAMTAKMYAMYGYEQGLEQIARVARRFPDDYWLSVAFGIFADERHPLGPSLIDLLRDPLPTGFARVMVLDLANALCRQNRLDPHPFNTTEGHQHLEEWLTDSDPGHFSYALSSAASLPFVDEDVRNRLAALAFDHPDPAVQMEAAWASAYRGNEGGLKFLARMATDPRYSVKAKHYLDELNRADVIPNEANEPTFEAMAEMCNWLAHPNECGRPPSEIELYDTRELFWFPTGDKRRVWLFRYRTDEGQDVGIGMVGSMTFSRHFSLNATGYRVSLVLF